MGKCIEQGVEEYTHKEKIKIWRRNRNWGRIIAIGWKPTTTPFKYTETRYKRRGDTRRIG